MTTTLYATNPAERRILKLARAVKDMRVGDMNPIATEHLALLNVELTKEEVFNRNNPNDCGLVRAEIELVNQDKKIQAIKAVRTRTGLGLAQAKDCVDKQAAKYGRNG